MGHILGSATLFLFVWAIAWGLGAMVHYMHQLHPFSANVLAGIHHVELALFVFDCLLSGFVLVVGAMRFIRDIIRGH